MIIGFSVSCSRSVQADAAAAQVPIHLESVIYRLIETVRNKTAALLPPRIESKIIGEATVLQIFNLNLPKRQTKTIAGCRVNNGQINKTDKVRVMRGVERTVVFEGTSASTFSVMSQADPSGDIDTLKHLKKDVTEIRKGTDCGIGIQNFNDIQANDEIVTFETFEVAREL
jgi:translation initiation factor IF-2